MSLQTRLQALQRQHAVAVPPRPAPAMRREGRAIEDLVPDHLPLDDWDGCFVVESVRSLEDRHGHHLFRDLATVTGSRFAAVSRDRELSYVDVSRAVFLDTETTGLVTGTGTYVFLVGAGYFDGLNFRVRQFFLRGPGEEPRFLDALGQFLAAFAAIVTFNGKAFDWPLLENRYIRHRRRPPLNDPAHVDLLHPARRLWKRRLESCALSSLESHVLGVSRSQVDVAGWEIPGRYFSYQRSGDASGLVGVFYHNLVDILSLATLTVHIDRVMNDPFCGLVDDPVDFLSLAKTYDRGGDLELAALCCEEALHRRLPPALQRECLMRLARLQKRQRSWDAAMRTWDLLLDEGGAVAVFALVEMAKYYEHVERDYPQAMEAVEQALVLSELHQAAWPAEERIDLTRRLARLAQRMGRGRGWIRRRG